MLVIFLMSIARQQQCSEDAARGSNIWLLYRSSSLHKIFCYPLSRYSSNRLKNYKLLHILLVLSLTYIQREERKKTDIFFHISLNSWHYRNICWNFKKCLKKLPY
uniref:Uncharacterized protein n=1 Tax=Octopus bimaculoides TaxID=37653 RepID=A0A0L8I7B9_OCTBM